MSVQSRSSRVVPMEEQPPAESHFSGLWFPNEVEEVAFEAAYVETRFKPVDKRRQGLVLAIVATFTLTRLLEDYRDGHLSLRGLSATFSSGMYLFLNWLWVRWEVDSRPGRRTGMVLLMRLLGGYLPIVFFSHVWFNDVVTTPQSVLRFLVMNTGILGLVFHTLAQPLLTWHHLLVHVPTVVFMALYTPRLTCTELTVTSESTAYLVAAWEWFSFASMGMRHSMVVSMPPAQECCETVVAMTQIMGGLFLPSFIMWTFEYHARIESNPRILWHRQPTWEAVWVHKALFFPVMSFVWALWHIGVRA